jgi:streptogramin lyase
MDAREIRATLCLVTRPTLLTNFLSAPVLFLTSACWILAGCGSNNPAPNGGGSTYTPPPGNFTGLPFSGKVLAGTTPMAVASVQVYAAGANGNASAPTQLFSGAFTTSSDGSFDVATGYTCPSATSVLYVVARGGVAGATGSDNNNAVMMSTLGECQSLGNTPGFVIDEATTVASAYAMAQFMAAGAAMGATATNSQGISNAANVAGGLINRTTGQGPGIAGQLPTARIDSLANALHACIVSSSSCAQFYAATTTASSTPSNTLDAVVNIAQHPANNVGDLYAASLLSPVYTPALPAAPSDWTMFATFTNGGLSNPTSIAVDSLGEVWVASYNGVASLFNPFGSTQPPLQVSGSGLSESYGLAVDAEDNAWITNYGSNSVSVFSRQGTAVSGASGYTGGGIDFPVGIAIDTTGTAWIADNATKRVTQLNASGSPVSSTGISSALFGGPGKIALNSKHEAYVANESLGTIAHISADGSSVTSIACCETPSAVAVDQSDNVWVTDSVRNTVSQITAAGTSVSAYTLSSVADPMGIAIDGSGNVWVSSNHRVSITELSGSQTSSPGQPLSPLAGYGVDAGLDGAYGIAIDASGNVWVSNGGNNTLTQFIGIATPVKTPLVGVVATP